MTSTKERDHDRQELHKRSHLCKLIKTKPLYFVLLKVKDLIKMRQKTLIHIYSGKEAVCGKWEVKFQTQNSLAKPAQAGSISNAVQSKILCYTFCSRTCHLFMFCH